MKKLDKMTLFIRFLQVCVVLIPICIGVFALLNDVTAYSYTLHSVIDPLVTMQGNKPEAWRAIPVSWSPLVYTAMFSAEFITAIFAAMGLGAMLRNITNTAEAFEKSKRWVYVACFWGTLVWGLGFYEGAGDWFLAWESTNAGISGLQQGGLMYATELLFVFVYLKLSREHA